jgi:GTP-binding protein EngB required for normal cell division
MFHINLNIKVELLMVDNKVNLVDQVISNNQVVKVEQLHKLDKVDKVDKVGKVDKVDKVDKVVNLELQDMEIIPVFLPQEEQEETIDFIQLHYSLFYYAI